ncbi:MAG: radical SAM protein, partial [Bacteroidetes bacterium]
MKSDTIQKGRGAQFNPPNRFDRLQYIGKQPSDGKTRYLKTHARTIVNKVDSPDIPLEFSM